MSHTAYVVFCWIIQDLLEKNRLSGERGFAMQDSSIEYAVVLLVIVVLASALLGFFLFKGKYRWVFRSILILVCVGGFFYLISMGVNFHDKYMQNKMGYASYEVVKGKDEALADTFDKLLSLDKSTFDKEKDGIYTVYSHKEGDNTITYRTSLFNTQVKIQAGDSSLTGWASLGICQGVVIYNQEDQNASAQIEVESEM